MDLGSLEIQIFVSLTVVLGAAFVALVCDYLKGNNEQLRERNIELRIRHEERERWLALESAAPAVEQESPPPRRGKKKRPAKVAKRESADWVRPEVMARISQEFTELPEPLNAAENWDIREMLSVRGKQTRAVSENEPPKTPEPVPMEAETVGIAVDLGRLAQELGHSQAPEIAMRPLTVPALKLQDEMEAADEHSLQRLARAAVWDSPLLEEVIAASGMRASTVAIASETPAPGTFRPYDLDPIQARTAGRRISSDVVFSPAPPPIGNLASRAIRLDPSALITAPSLPEPPPLIEPPPPPPQPELILPKGMHDLATWNHLLAQPDPLTGILFVISLQPRDGASVHDSKTATLLAETAPAIEKLITSFVRDGDFGSRIGAHEWVFIYADDSAGFNQRRVGTISEKLWDFQLRHLGISNANFKWGTVTTQHEKLDSALQAARDRMNQSWRTAKEESEDSSARRAVNA